MYMLVLVLLIVTQFIIVAAQNCRDFRSCESCAGNVIQGRKCRWCMTSSTCESSKYTCHPTKSTMTIVNCPYPDSYQFPYYNDSYVRNEVIFHSHAVNRVGNSDSSNAVLSCINKADVNTRIVRQFDVSVLDRTHSNAALVAINDMKRRITVSFRATISRKQWMAQMSDMIIRRYTKFELGGSVLSYYYDAFHELLRNGTGSTVVELANQHPNYEILVTGHSLGGGLANMFSLYFALILTNNISEISLSGPRIGDEEYAMMHDARVFNTFRVIKDSDLVPDAPYRVGELTRQPFHSKHEILYESSMEPDGYKICKQPESEECNRGHWLQRVLWASAHGYMFGRSMFPFFLGDCK